VPRAKWFYGLVAVSRFFCFPIVKNIAENQKWPGNPVWRAAVSNPPGRYMRGGPLARRGPSGSLRVGKIKKVVKRRGVGVLVLRLEIYSQGTTEQQVDLGREGRGLFLGGVVRCRVAEQV
jgi:hypothetical protein